MAETVVYSREFLFIKEMYKKGELGKIQHLAASHPQDMDGWPDYWEKMIPMHYATHVVSPCLGLVDKRAEYVAASARARCGRTSRKSRATSSPSRRATSRSRTPTSSAHIWRFLYDTARQYRESFDVYGTKKSFEWTLIEHEPHIIHTAKKPEPEIPEQGDGARLRAPAARADPPVHAAGGDSRRRAPLVHPGRRPRRLAPAPGQRDGHRPRRRTATPGPTPAPAPTGPAWASAPTSRPKRAARS